VREVIEITTIKKTVKIFLFMENSLSCKDYETLYL
jgi:hypothetical protein